MEQLSKNFVAEITKALGSTSSRKKGVPAIFDSVSHDPLADAFGVGAVPGAGTFVCLGCGNHLNTRVNERLPRCRECGGKRFRRDSIFSARQEHESPPTVEHALPHAPARPAWLDEARATLPGHGQYLVLRGDEGDIRRFQILRGWTRIGRSIAADLRLDDPSVSRRHALVVSEPGKELRVLDDRSLNGVLVNGEAVEWETLHDGDELTIGRFHVFALTK